MDTADFLRHILPRKGVFVLIHEVDNIKKHENFTDISAMAEAALHWDRQGFAVYHACNSFNSKPAINSTTGKRYKTIRSANNVAACRSLYIDTDVGEGEGKYATKKEAIEAVKSLIRAVNLLPTIVDSGGGFHLYWSLTDDIDPEEWRKLSAQLRAIVVHTGFKFDRAVDSDLARYLRTVGSFNRKPKYPSPLPVRALTVGKHYTLDEITKAFSEYIARHKLEVQKKNNGENLNDLTGGIDYPPSSAHEIIKHCAALAHFEKTRGNVPEPYWRDMLGLLKYTVEGETLAHEWSAGYTGYSAAETQSKIDNWVGGPPRCETVSMHCDFCRSCVHWGKITSPISLGFVEQKQQLPYWPSGYRWDGQHISKAVRNQDGVTEYVPFCSTLVYPITRVKEIDGTWALYIRAYPDTDLKREFLVPMSLFAEANNLASHLASYEVFTVGNNGNKLISKFFQDYVKSLQDAKQEAITYSQFGWCDDKTAFLIGSTKITSKGELQAIPSKRVGLDLVELDKTKGTEEDWVNLVDKLYNRPGAEPYQFIICAAFASPLIELAESPTWHGIPIAMTSETSLGKTSVMKIACSIYGNADKLYITGNDEGTTITSLINRFATLKNIPFVIDEISGRDHVEIRNVLYCAANGKAKERMLSTGDPHPANDLRWNMMTFISGNDELSEKLAQLKNVNQSEAVELRVFEIKLDENLYYIWKGENVQKIVERDLLPNHYGCVGRKWIKFVLENKSKIKKLLYDQSDKHAPTSRHEAMERYYIYTLVYATVAGELAKRLGFINFDIAGMFEWGKRYIEYLRTGRMERKVTPEEYLARFLLSLNGRILITRRMGDRRSLKAEPALDPIPRGEIVARHAIEDKVFFFSLHALQRWCEENGVSLQWLVKGLKEDGFFVDDKYLPAKRREYLTRGTNYMSTRMWVYELDYAKTMGLMAMDKAVAEVIGLNLVSEASHGAK